MPLSSADRPRAPLLLLGLALAVLAVPDRACGQAAASAVQQAHDNHSPAKAPDAFPGFSPETRGMCPALAPSAGHEGTRFESRLFAMPLPADLTPRQQRIALAIMREAEPSLTVLHRQLRQTLVELHNLSFASDTPPDALAALGRRLILLREKAMRELQRVSAQMEKLAGFNPGWGSRARARAMPGVSARPLVSEPNE